MYGAQKTCHGQRRNTEAIDHHHLGQLDAANRRHLRLRARCDTYFPDFALAMHVRKSLLLAPPAQGGGQWNWPIEAERHALANNASTRRRKDRKLASDGSHIKPGGIP